MAPTQHPRTPPARFCPYCGDDDGHSKDCPWMAWEYHPMRPLRPDAPRANVLGMVVGAVIGAIVGLALYVLIMSAG